MTEAEILLDTYQDTLTVYRPFKTNIDGETQFFKGIDGRQVYIDIPCALSTSSVPRAKKRAIDVDASADFDVFVMPNIDIEPNDTLKVEHLNKVYILMAGRADRQLSHNRVPCTLKHTRA